MGDAVRPSVEERRSVYERGFRTWLNLYLCAKQESCLPQICFQIQSVILQQPHFPHDLDLKHSYGLYLSATGTSIWEASQGPCTIPALEKQLDIPISIPSPTRLTLSSSSDSSHHNLFSREQDHISVLILAWSYIFSARWADLMPGSTVLEYTHSQAQWKEDEPADSDSVLVDIGDVDGKTARWWAAILASGEGWQASISSGEVKFRSPWSIIFDSASSFTLSRHKACPIPPSRAVPYATAIRLLSDYCTLHGVMDQSHAALSAVLFLPYLHGRGKEICLPRPTFCRGMQVESAVPQPSVQLDLVWAQMAHHLDRLLTLSCNTKGIRAMLSSIFYEPGIACNCVSPWLQSIFAILDSVENSRILAHILMSRTPHLAFLWLGGIIMGIHKEVLRDGRFGLIPLELHGAMWSGTVQSFIQEPTQQHPGMNKSISRSDECRLLYLTQEECHRRWPMCQWVPFGASDLGNTEIDVRLHAECPGHHLKYAGWRWACQNAMVTHQPCDPTLIPAQPLAQDVASNIHVNYEAFDLEDESASENATRSIFGWLRFEGYPSQERNIYQHEWVKIDDSDDEDLPDYGSRKSHTSILNHQGGHLDKSQHLG